MLLSGFVSLMLRDLILTSFHPERIASLSQETDSKACAHMENAFKLCAEEFPLTLLTQLLVSVLRTVFWIPK